MKKISYFFATLALGGMMLQSCNNNTNVVLTNEADSVNYAWGTWLGFNSAQDFDTFPQLDRKVYVSAIKDIVLNDKDVMSIEEASMAMENFATKYYAKMSDTTSTVTFNAGTDYDALEVSKALGVSTAMYFNDLKQLPCGYNADLIMKGLESNIDGAKGAFTIEEASAVIEKYATKVQKEEEAKSEILNEEFMEKYKNDPSYKETSTGLLYKVIKEGNGAKPGPTTTVRVHYEGKLLDGTIFDSSYQRNEPAEFPLNMVIPGWTEGLQLMSVGSTYELVIPARLGYGSRSVSIIPPNSVLVFKVELLDIVK